MSLSGHLDDFTEVRTSATLLMSLSLVLSRTYPEKVHGVWGFEANKKTVSVEQVHCVLEA
jgi:hypothetical protein